MRFDAKKFIEKSILLIKNTIGDKKAIIAVSGGVDSTTCASLVNRAIPNQLTCVFIDTGLLRQGEREYVENLFKKLNITLKVIDASEQYFEKLKGILEPEKKRKIIGELFIRLFEEQAKNGDYDFLIQGTIAPDWIESGGSSRKTIKSHHNVGGLPEKMGLKVFEPIRDLYKHEVRMLAQELGLDKSVFERQPFPGPGLAVRVVGEITPKKIEIVRKACHIVETEIEDYCTKNNLQKPWQYFASLLDIKTVGVEGDERVYKYPIVVRAVRSLDGMTANFSNLPHDLLTNISRKITNEIREVGRVFYDITNKPPGTIEME